MIQSCKSLSQWMAVFLSITLTVVCVWGDLIKITGTTYPLCPSPTTSVHNGKWQWNDARAPVAFPFQLVSSHVSAEQRTEPENWRISVCLTISRKDASRSKIFWKKKNTSLWKVLEWPEELLKCVSQLPAWRFWSYLWGSGIWIFIKLWLILMQLNTTKQR